MELTFVEYIYLRLKIMPQLFFIILTLFILEELREFGQKIDKLLSLWYKSGPDFFEQILLHQILFFFHLVVRPIDINTVIFTDNRWCIFFVFVNFLMLIVFMLVDIHNVLQNVSIMQIEFSFGWLSIQKI